MTIDFTKAVNDWAHQWLALSEDITVVRVQFGVHEYAFIEDQAMIEATIRHADNGPLEVRYINLMPDDFALEVYHYITSRLTLAD